MQTYDKKKGSHAKAGKQAPAPAPVQSVPNSAFLTDGASRIDLPEAMRSKMESAYGTDLSAVKVYQSQKVADGGAEAVTMGNTIAFAPGKFDMTSQSGQALLGHEMSHVVSQSRGEVQGSGVVENAALEARADKEGAMAAAGEQVYNGPVTAPISSASPAAMAGPMQCKKLSKRVKEMTPYQRATAKKKNKEGHLVPDLDVYQPGDDKFDEFEGHALRINSKKAKKKGAWKKTLGSGLATLSAHNQLHGQDFYDTASRGDDETMEDMAFVGNYRMDKSTAEGIQKRKIARADKEGSVLSSAIDSVLYGDYVEGTTKRGKKKMVAKHAPLPISVDGTDEEELIPE